MADTNEITTQLGVEAKSGRVIKDSDIATMDLDPGYIVADRIPSETVSAGGIHLTVSAQEERNFGWVVAVPDGECKYERGDLVMWQIGAGCRLEYKSTDSQEEYYLVLEILGLRPQVLARWKAKNVKHIAKRFGFSLDKAPGGS